MLASRNGVPCTVLMDFGIARRISRFDGKDSTGITQAGDDPWNPRLHGPRTICGKGKLPRRATSTRWGLCSMNL